MPNGNLYISIDTQNIFTETVNFVNMNSAKTIRAIVGFLVLMAILLRGNAIMNYIEVYPWLGIALLLCAVAYILWGMFRKENKV